MRILKKFELYVKENIDSLEDESEMSDVDIDSYSDEFTSDTDTDLDSEINETGEEEGGDYIGNQLLKELADRLDTEVVDNSINFDGKTINFFSETESFHVDKKKFKTVDEVVEYLTGDKQSTNDFTSDLEEDTVGEEKFEEELVESKITRRFRDFQ